MRPVSVDTPFLARLPAAPLRQALERRARLLGQLRLWGASGETLQKPTSVRRAQWPQRLAGPRGTQVLRGGDRRLPRPQQSLEPTPDFKGRGVRPAEHGGCRLAQLLQLTRGLAADGELLAADGLDKCRHV